MHKFASPSQNMASKKGLQCVKRRMILHEVCLLIIAALLATFAAIYFLNIPNQSPESAVTAKAQKMLDDSASKIKQLQNMLKQYELQVASLNDQQKNCTQRILKVERQNKETLAAMHQVAPQLETAQHETRQLNNFVRQNISRDIDRFNQNTLFISNKLERTKHSMQNVMNNTVGKDDLVDFNKKFNKFQNRVRGNISAVVDQITPQLETVQHDLRRLNNFVRQNISNDIYDLNQKILFDSNKTGRINQALKDVMDNMVGKKEIAFISSEFNEFQDQVKENISATMDQMRPQLEAPQHDMKRLEDFVRRNISNNMVRKDEIAFMTSEFNEFQDHVRLNMSVAMDQVLPQLQTAQHGIKQLDDFVRQNISSDIDGINEKTLFNSNELGRTSQAIEDVKNDMVGKEEIALMSSELNEFKDHVRENISAAMNQVLPQLEAAQQEIRQLNNFVRQNISIDIDSGKRKTLFNSNTLEKNSQAIENVKTKLKSVFQKINTSEASLENLRDQISQGDSQRPQIFQQISELNKASSWCRNKVAKLHKLVENVSHNISNMTKTILSNSKEIQKFLAPPPPYYPDDDDDTTDETEHER